MKEENFRIHRVYYHDIKNVYPELYGQIFPDRNDLQVPTFVYLGWYKEKYVGFMSAYLHNVNSIYLQFAGFVDRFKGYMAPVLFKRVIEYVHRDFDNIICRIENTNIKALKVALNAGFKIIGIRFDSNILFVELLKIKEN